MSVGSSREYSRQQSPLPSREVSPLFPLTMMQKQPAWKKAVSRSAATALRVAPKVALFGGGLGLGYALARHNFTDSIGKTTRYVGRLFDNVGSAIHNTRYNEVPNDPSINSTKVTPTPMPRPAPTPRLVSASVLKSKSEQTKNF